MQSCLIYMDIFMLKIPSMVPHHHHHCPSINTQIETESEKHSKDVFKVKFLWIGCRASVVLTLSLRWWKDFVNVLPFILQLIWCSLPKCPHFLEFFRWAFKCGKPIMVLSAALLISKHTDLRHLVDNLHGPCQSPGEDVPMQLHSWSFF